MQPTAPIFIGNGKPISSKKLTSNITKPTMPIVIGNGKPISSKKLTSNIMKPTEPIVIGNGKPIRSKKSTSTNTVGSSQSTSTSPFSYTNLDFGKNALSKAPMVYAPLDFSIPGGTPMGVIRQIKCKVCPPPLGPEVANQQLVSVNQAIEEQTNMIEKLENYIVDLEKRYKVKFDSNVSISNGEFPSANIGGSLDNIKLNLHVVQGITGPKGLPGVLGKAGKSGKPGPIGPRGPTGYWGNIV